MLKMTPAEFAWYAIGCAERNGAHLAPDGPDDAAVQEFEALRALSRARREGKAG